MVKSRRTRGSGFMQRTTECISTRGVKYWPAPFFPSLAAFVGGGLHVHADGRPFGLVDLTDEPLEVDVTVHGPRATSVQRHGPSTEPRSGYLGVLVSDALPT